MVVEYFQIWWRYGAFSETPLTFFVTLCIWMQAMLEVVLNLGNLDIQLQTERNRQNENVSRMKEVCWKKETTL